MKKPSGDSGNTTENKLTGTAQTWLEASKHAEDERRVERRVPMVFPIELTGINAEDKNFSEQTFTLNLSQSGCCFQTLQHLKRGTLIGISLIDRQTNLSGALQVHYEVAWAELLGDLWVVGAKKITSDSIWRPEWNGV